MKLAFFIITAGLAIFALFSIFAAAHSISQSVGQPAVLTVHMSAKGFDLKPVSTEQSTTKKSPALSKKIADYSFSIFAKFNLQKPLTQKSNPPGAQSTLSNVLETTDSLYTTCAATERQKSIDKMTCYAIKFTNITLQTGPEYALNVLLALQKKDPDALNCHFIGHAIGYGVYAHDPAQSVKLIEKVNNICSYGIAMGIIEMYATDYLKGNLDDAQTLLNICDNTTNRGCNHGLGHVLLVAKNGNLNESLKSCSIFNSERSKPCYRGVFMEYITPLNLIAHGLANETWMNRSYRIDELEKLCRSFDGQVAEACWGQLDRVAVVKYKNNAKLVLDFCNTAPTMETAKACKVDAVSLFASSHNFNITAVKPTCETERATDPAFENYCYTTLVNTALDNLKIQKGEDVVEFCSSVPKKFRGSCFKTIAQTLVIQQDTPASQMQDICKNAPSEYVKVCLGT